LKEAMRRDEKSIDPVAAALVRFEKATGHKDFRKFHREQAKAFKHKLSSEKNACTGKPLAHATVHSTLAALRAFFIWLAGQPGYKSQIAYADADYFNLSEKDVRIAKASREQPVPTLEQVHHVLSNMPALTDIEKRNRALIAFAILTGARDGALATFKLKHINLAEGVVFQDARDVKTKASKSFSTWFFPVGGDALKIFKDWCQHLRDVRHWGDSIRYSRKHCWDWELAAAFRPLGNAANVGAMPGRSAPFLRMPSRRLVYPILIRIAFGTLWSSSEWQFANWPKRSKHGRRIWVTRKS